MNDELTPIEHSIDTELIGAKESFRFRAFRKFILAAIGGIPWVGSFIVAAAELKEDSGQEETDNLQRQWLAEHELKLGNVIGTLNQIAAQLENFGDQVDERLASPEFLELVEQGFRIWDKSATKEKRESIRRLLTNAAATRLCSDDLVRLFLKWIDDYHESHFKVIRAIYNGDRTGRGDIWREIHGEFPREDSAEADLYKLLIHDLSMGHVIRQKRKTTSGGQFYQKKPAKRRTGVKTMKSAFDNADPYELTALGRQFVHYTMDDVAPQIGDGQPNSPR